MAAEALSFTPSKRPHWTQTDEGRRKMSIAQRRSWKRRRKPKMTRAEHVVKKHAHVGRPRKVQPTSGILIDSPIVIDGWRITPIGGRLKIEQV